jgi:outer membrane immunogenic protein
MTFETEMELGTEMKKVLLTTVGLIALGLSPALAADLPARTYTKAPAPIAPLPSWTGFYIGAMGGYAQEDATFAAMKGGFAGGTLGYNWQAGQMVYGIEADAAWADVKASAGFPGLLTVSAKIQDMGTVRGRIGVVFDQVLFYGTGGYAWADTKVSATALNAVTLSDSKVLNGWTIGAGIEAMFAPHWSVKGEYLYRSFNGQTFFTNLVPGGVSTGTLNVNSVQVGVNYHF